MTRAMNMLLLGNQKEYMLLNLFDYTAFCHNIEYFRYKIGIRFNQRVLVVQQNSYATKSVNTCIVYNFDNCPRNPLNSFTLKNCLFCSNDIVNMSRVVME